MITVTSEVSEAFKTEATALCKKLNLNVSAFNQDTNAMAVYNTLRKLGLKVVDDSGKELKITITNGKDGKPLPLTDEQKRLVNLKSQMLQLFKKGGNASANRQALMGKTAATAQVTEIADGLLSD